MTSVGVDPSTRVKFSTAQAASAEGRGQLRAWLCDLIASDSLESVVDLATHLLSHRFGATDVRLVWRTLHGADACDTWQRLPNDAWGEDLDLVDTYQRGEAAPRRALGNGLLRLASPLHLPDAQASAVLLTTIPHATLDSPTRRKRLDRLLELISASVGSAIARERTRRSLARLEQADRLQRALFAIVDMAGSDLEMPELLRGLQEIVGTLMYAENLYIFLYDPQREQIRFIYFLDVEDKSSPELGREFPLADIQHSLTWHLIRRGKPLMGTPSLLKDQIDGPFAARGTGCVDWLGVPLIARNEVRGGIVVQSYLESARYSEDDRVLLEFMARHILTALERKRAHEELERRVDQRTGELAEANIVLRNEVQERQRGERVQAALFRIAELAVTTESLEAYCAAAHHVVGELMYAENFFIVLLDAPQATLRFVYFADSVDREIPDPRTDYPLKEFEGSLTWHLLRRGRSLMGPPLAIAEELESPLVRHGAQCVDWLGVPLLAEATVRGAIVVQSYDATRRYTREDLSLLIFLGFHIGTWIERKRAQESLRMAYAELERRVDERTSELADANRELRDQIQVREHVESRLKYEALHDALTGLPNRALLLDRLGHALTRFRRDHNQQFAVLFLDLDRFKVVNDSVGHFIGDGLLKEASARISACLREEDTVARLGGDEFAILLEDLHGSGDPSLAAGRVIAALNDPIRVAGKELFTSASIGIALSHPRYSRAEELLRDADVAMYRAKANGRQRFELFDERLHDEALKLLDLEGDLRRAIARNEFEPHFQAICSLRDQRVIGYEALLRWRHAERGMLLPADFIVVAEESGSAELIDWQMFELTCREISRLVEDGQYVSINVSARHFRAADLEERILGLLRTHNIAAEKIRIEVTEGTLLENPEQIRLTLESLRRHGVLTQLDDFGTGYSSLSYLHRFPLHALKIDRSFVSDLRPHETGGSAAVVRAIVALARSLGLEIIAEGIETTEQCAALQEIGCMIGQGFLFAHPRSAGELIEARRFVDARA